MENLNDWINKVADEGKRTRDTRDFLEKVQVMKSEIRRRRSIEWQRDQLIREMAFAMGIDLTEFTDFINNG